MPTKCFSFVQERKPIVAEFAQGFLLWPLVVTSFSNGTLVSVNPLAGYIVERCFFEPSFRHVFRC